MVLWAVPWTCGVNFFVFVFSALFSTFLWALDAIARLWPVVVWWITDQGSLLAKKVAVLRWSWTVLDTFNNIMGSSFLQPARLKLDKRASSTHSLL